MFRSTLQGRLELVKWKKVVEAIILFTFLTVVPGCSSVSPSYTKPAETNATGAQIATISKSLLGTPYRFGGDTPKGFDCSGLIHYVYKQAGIEVPRSSQLLYLQAKKIPLDKLQSGDLLFFKISGKTVSHVAIYLNNERFIHAPSSGKSVSTARLDSRYWSIRLAGAGRFW
jgi:cell wall-associated NlpC family hydrolase